MLEARGEKVRLSPEKVGLGLKKLGLRTQPLSQADHGLRFTQVVLSRIQELTALYGMEEILAGAENLHAAQTT